MTTYPFRKKPIEIKAVRWWPGKPVDGVDVLNEVVHTVNGPVEIEPGEWIITGINGETYPCKDEIFRKTYDCVTCGGHGTVWINVWDLNDKRSTPCPACAEPSR